MKKCYIKCPTKFKILSKKVINMLFPVKESLFEFIADKLSDFIIITDVQGNIKLINKPLLELLKTEKEKLLNKHFSEIFGTNIFQTMKYDKPTMVPIIYNNQKIPLRLSASIIFKEEKPSGILIVARDKREASKLTQDMETLKKTFRKKEEETSTKLTLLSDALASVGESVFVTNIEQRLIYCNKTAIETFGYKKGEILGKKPDLLYKTDKSGSFGMEKNWKGEITAYKKIGEPFPGLLTTSPVKNKLGNKIGAIGVIRNIIDIKIMMEKLSSMSTELEKRVKLRTKELEKSRAQLLQSSKMAAIGTLAAGIAHELNNPLTIIMGYCHLLINEIHIPEDIKEKLKKIYEQCERSKKIVYNLSIFARSHKTEKQFVNVIELIEKVLDLRNYDLSLKNITIVKKFQENLPRIYGDEHQLQQVLLNLLNNAVDAILGSKTEGKIILRLIKKDGNIKISITDNGCGIEEKNIKKIFDPFYTTKEVGKGTGLGLSISYGIIKAHNGDIKVKSKKGTGSRFVITLPSEEGKPSHKEQKHSEEFSKKSGDGKNILVVDDEDMIVELLSNFLSHHGYNTKGVMAGEQALELIEKKNFDLIISDYRMPGLGGKKLYEKLIEIKPEMAKKILFITGEIAEEKSLNFMKKTGIPVIHKPFDINEFINTVNSLVNQIDITFQKSQE